MIFQKNNKVTRSILPQQQHKNMKINFNYINRRIQSNIVHGYPNQINVSPVILANTKSFPMLTSKLYSSRPIIPINSNIQGQTLSKITLSNNKRLKIFDRNYSINNLHLQNQKQMRYSSRIPDEQFVQLKSPQSLSIFKKRRRIFSPVRQKENKLKSIKIKENRSRKKQSNNFLKSSSSSLNKMNRIKQNNGKKFKENMDSHRTNKIRIIQAIKEQPVQLRIESKSTIPEKQALNNSYIDIFITHSQTSEKIFLQKSSTSINQPNKTSYNYLSEQNKTSPNKINFLTVSQNKENIYKNKAPIKLVDRQQISLFYYLPAIIIVLGLIILIIQVLK